MKMVSTGCGSSFRMYSAGSVKIAPATTDPARPPIPVMMTFSSTLERRGYARARPMARMEMGIADSMTWPTFSPEYAEATVKTMHSSRPHATDRGVSSGRIVEAGTTGWYAVPGGSGVYALEGSWDVSLGIGETVS